MRIVEWVINYKKRLLIFLLLRNLS